MSPVLRMNHLDDMRRIESKREADDFAWYEMGNFVFQNRGQGD
jgi:hypothetical protein